MFTIVLFNRYWLKCVYQTAGNHCSPSLLLIVWGFFPDFFVIGHLSQGSVTSQPPRTRSFISAWSSPPQFNRFAHFLGQQDMYSRPLRNPPLHNCEKHWAHTSPGAQTCRIKRRREVLWEMWSGKHDRSPQPSVWTDNCKHGVFFEELTTCYKGEPLSVLW